MPEMDTAAEAAAVALNALPKEHVEAVAAWWQAHYLSAGHKRLGRVLLGKANGAAVVEVTPEGDLKF